MSNPRLPRSVLLCAFLFLPLAPLTAQRGEKPSGKPVQSAPAPTPMPRPQMPTPAPRPIETPRPMPTPRPAPTPRPIAEQPRPSYPQPAPRPVAEQPRPSYPQPTPRPAPRPVQSQPQPQPQWSQPAPAAPRNDSPRSYPRPVSTPRPRTPGSDDSPVRPRPRDADIRTPGRDQKPVTPQPSTPDNPVRPVGGPIRVVDRGGKRADDQPLRPRDLYDDTMTRPKPKPLPAAPRPGDGRPVTTKSIVDRYHPTPLPTADDGKPIKPAAPRPRTPTAGAPTVRPQPIGGSVKPLADRYNIRPGSGVRPGARPLAPTVDHVPTLVPRPNTPGRGVVNAPIAARPTLVPRPRTTSAVLSRGFGRTGSCFGPVWDPCWSGCNWWSSSCSPGLYWTLGIGSGSFCWGWSSWLPWYCHRSHFCWSYRPWWDPCWDACSSPLWWYPYTSTVYVPSYVYVNPTPTSSSTVVVSDGDLTAGDETIEVGHRELTPAEQARRFVDLGDFYFREGRFREAADTYDKARALAPTDASIHFVLADAQFALGDYHFAAFLIGEALRLDPELARADTDKRLLYGDPKLFEQQIATLVKYLDEKPYDAMAHLVLGYNLKFSGKPKDAEKALRRVLEIDPESKAAQLLLEALTTPAKAPAADTPPAAAPEKAKVEETPAASDR